MTLITSDELKSRFTDNPIEFEQSRASRESQVEPVPSIFLQHRSEDNFENASYDISVGRIAFKLTELVEEIDFPKGSDSLESDDQIAMLCSKSKAAINTNREEVVIRPGEGFLIYSREKLGLPLSVTVIVTTKISMAFRGALQITSRVNPGWGPDYLSVPIFNFGRDVIALRPGDRFANLLFLQHGEAPDDKAGPPKRKWAQSYEPEDLTTKPVSDMIADMRNRTPVLNRVGNILGRHEAKLDAFAERIGRMERRIDAVEEMPDVIARGLGRAAGDWKGRLSDNNDTDRS